MKNKFRFLVVSLFLVVTLSTILIIKSSNNISDNNNEINNIVTSKYNIKDMNLKEKIGQMLIIDYTKDTYDTNLDRIIKTVKPGGFILMSDNIKYYDNTISLVKSLKQNSNIPMIIAIDEEGGRVQRTILLKDTPVTNVPSMYELGKTNNQLLAYQVGVILAKKVKTLGVNLDFAPVLDIYSNKNNKVIGDRSLSEDKNIVTNLSISIQKGLEDNNVNTCIKHFPGHGDTKTDSHFDIPIINKTYKELLDNELYPFIKSIENGSKMVMVGHIALPKITTSNVPASLSKEIITDVLKNKLNFTGLVITDALNMKALTNNYTEKEIYINAINAGVDILLMPQNPENAVKYIEEAIKENKISINQIDASVEKILNYKEKYLKDEYLDKSYLSKEEYNTVLNKIIKRSKL